MTAHNVTDVPRPLEAAQAGDRPAATRLLPLVYNELHKLAAAQLAHEKPGRAGDAWRAAAGDM